MATAILPLNESTEFKQIDDGIIDVDLSKSAPYYTNRPSYKKEIPEIDSLTIKEKIAFIIDCYSFLYQRMSEIENRLERVEIQNQEMFKLFEIHQSAISTNEECFVEMDPDQMKDIIIEYYKTHKIVYPSDIAFELNLDLRKVVQIINDLIKDGIVKGAS